MILYLFLTVVLYGRVSTERLSEQGAFLKQIEVEPKFRFHLTILTLTVQVILSKRMS